MAATAAMAAVSMASAYQDAAAMGAQADQEEAVGRINADILKIKEDEALRQGDKNLDKFKKQVNQLKAQQRVGMGASGTSIDYGSNLALQEDTDLMSIEDETRIKNNAMLEAWGYKTEASNQMMKAKYAADALRNKASATLLGGAFKSATYLYEGNGKLKVPDKTDYKIPSNGQVISGQPSNPNTRNTG